MIRSGATQGNTPFLCPLCLYAGRGGGGLQLPIQLQCGKNAGQMTIANGQQHIAACQETIQPFGDMDTIDGYRSAVAHTAFPCA